MSHPIVSLFSYFVKSIDLLYLSLPICQIQEKAKAEIIKIVAIQPLMIK